MDERGAIAGRDELVDCRGANDLISVMGGINSSQQETAATQIFDPATNS